MHRDILFSCLGTTPNDAGSKKAQWNVEHNYQYHSVGKNAAPRRQEKQQQLILLIPNHLFYWHKKPFQ